MALGRPGAGLEHDVARPEILDPAGRSEAPIIAAPYPGGEFRGIAGRIGLGDGIEIELGHGSASC